MIIFFFIFLILSLFGLNVWYFYILIIFIYISIDFCQTLPYLKKYNYQVFIENFRYYFYLLPTTFRHNLQKFFCFEIIGYFTNIKKTTHIVVIRYLGYILLFIFFFEAYLKERVHFSFFLFVLFISFISVLFAYIDITQQFILTQINHFCNKLNIKLNSDEHLTAVNTFLTPEEFYNLFPEETADKWYSYNAIKFFSSLSDTCDIVENVIKANIRILLRFFLTTFLFSITFALLQYSVLSPYVDYILIVFVPFICYFLPRMLITSNDDYLKKGSPETWLLNYNTWYSLYINVRKPWEKNTF